MAKHFEINEGSIEFTIGKQSFEAYGVLPAEDFADFIGIVGQMSADTKNDDEDAPDPTPEESVAELKRQIAKTMEAVAYCCPEDDAKRLADSLKKGAEHPVGFATLVAVLQWLMTEYRISGVEDEDAKDSDRPTQPTSDSPDT